MPEQPSADFSIETNNNGLKAVIEESNQFLKSHGISEKTVDEQIMVLEEIVKCGTAFDNFGPSDGRTRIGINIDKEVIRIEVSRSLNDSAVSRIQELDKIIQFINGFQDPFDAFIKIRSDSSSPHRSHFNGDGLARIAYEGKAMVDFFVNEHNVLKLYAIRDLRDECKN